MELGLYVRVTVVIGVVGAVVVIGDVVRKILPLVLVILDSYFIYYKMDYTLHLYFLKK